MPPKRITSVLLALFLIGCSTDPQSYPYLLELEETYNFKAIPIDIDTDGRDELVQIILDNEADQVNALKAMTQSGQTIGQQNLSSKPTTGAILTEDITGDGIQDILMSTQRNDSLFISHIDFNIRDKTSELVNEFFLYSGKEKTRNGVTYKWVSSLNALSRIRSNQSDSSYLVGMFVTKHTGHPRGIVKFANNKFEIADSFFVGARLNQPLIEKDVDGNGTVDWLLTSNAVDNQFSMNGLSDDRNYALLFDLEDFRKIWEKDLGLDQQNQNAGIFLANVDNSPEKEAIVYKRNNSVEPALRVFNVKDGQENPEYRHETALTVAFPIPTSGATELGLILLDNAGNVFKINPDLSGSSKLTSFNGVTGIYQGPDIDGDGIQNLYVHTAAAVHILNQDLRIIAKLLTCQTPTAYQWLRQGTNLEPLLLTTMHAINKSNAYRVKRNPFYLLYRLQAILLWGLVGVVFSFGLYARKKLKPSLQEAKVLKNKIKTLEKATVKQEQERSKLQSQVRDSLLPSTQTSFIQAIRNTLEEHGTSPSFDVQKFADRIGYSDRQLTRLIPDVVGLTPSELILAYKIAEAKRLIKQKELSMAEISDACGFKNPSQFSTSFLKVTGLTPSAYRDS